MAEKRPFTTFPRSEDMLAQLEKTPLAPLYLFHGEEPYLIEQAVMSVRRKVGKGTEVRSFVAGEDSLDRVLETWGVPSLFASASLVVLKRADRLKAADRERLEREAEVRDASQPLVVCAQTRVDTTQKFFERCAKTGFVAEFRPPFINQVPAWAQRFARERKLQLTDDAAALLSDLIGGDLFALANEIDKLAAFVSPKTAIDADTVSVCVGDLPTSTVFDLADALGQRDRQKALALLRQVLRDDRDALPVLHALVGHFRRVWRVKELIASGAPEIQIERATGLRGMRLRTMLGQSRLFTFSDLRRVMHRAAELDLTFKSSRVSPAALFDSLILTVCARSQS